MVNYLFCEMLRRFSFLEKSFCLGWWISHPHIYFFIFYNMYFILWLVVSNGRADPDLTICTDAFLEGWGAVCDDITTKGPWTLTDHTRHINELELLGALYGLQSFMVKSSNISSRLFLDNSTVVTYIDKCGGLISIYDNYCSTNRGLVWGLLYLSFDLSLTRCS